MSRRTNVRAQDFPQLKSLSVNNVPDIWIEAKMFMNHLKFLEMRNLKPHADGYFQKADASKCKDYRGLNTLIMSNCGLEVFPEMVLPPHPPFLPLEFVQFILNSLNLIILSLDLVLGGSSQLHGDLALLITLFTSMVVQIWISAYKLH